MIKMVVAKMISLHFLASEETVTGPPIAASQPDLTDSNNISTSQHGTRKLLSSLRNLLDVINKVHCLPSLVHTLLEHH